jgi:hypothetical protein
MVPDNIASLSNNNNNNGSYVSNNLANSTTLGSPLNAPAGNPPVMNPANLLGKMDNVWIETKSAEGKSYYYHARTRETSWTKPDSAVVVTQEQYAASLQQQTHQIQMNQRPPLIQGAGKS